MKNPKISVIMPVFNNEAYVEPAVNSILIQSFADFEFIIVDDHSTDHTKSILDRIQDKRIVRINALKHQGNYKCRNRGLDLAKGKYVCVMDSDDLAAPDRLSKQYCFMESNREYLAIGSDIEFLREDFSTTLFQRLREPEALKVALLKDNVCTHPTLMIRNDVLKMHHIRYNEAYYYAGDYDLLTNITKIGAISNLPIPLLKYRIHSRQISISKNREQMMYANQIRLKQLSCLEKKPSIDEILLHLSLMNEQAIPEGQWKYAEKWCNKLMRGNQEVGVYSPKCLYEFLKKSLFICMKKAKCLLHS